LAALVARAGLKLQANEIVELGAAYRKDRAGFERLRAMVTPADEMVHAYRASRHAGRPEGDRSGVSG
jgi:hypothetical protein